MTNFKPIPKKNSSALATFRRATTKILLVVPGEVSPWWPPDMKVPELCNYFPKVVPRPRIISILCLIDVRVCGPELSDERKEPYVI